MLTGTPAAVLGKHPQTPPEIRNLKIERKVQFAGLCVYLATREIWDNPRAKLGLDRKGFLFYGAVSLTVQMRLGEGID